MLQSMGSQIVGHDWGTEQQHILHFGKHWSGLISLFKMRTKPHSTAALSSEGGTMVGRDYCCWAEWGLRQQLCKVSSAAASLGRTSKGYDRVFPESCQPLVPTNPWSLDCLDKLDALCPKRCITMVGMVNSICQLDSLRLSTYLAKHYLWMFLGGCFWMRLAFESVSRVTQTALPNVHGPHPIYWIKA